MTIRTSRQTLRPRNPELTFDATIPRHWLAGSPSATHIANGVNLLFPAGERFFVRAVHHFADRIDDPDLRAQLRGFFGQEGRHARAHEDFFNTLRAQGYEIDRFLAIYERFTYDFLEPLFSPEMHLASTAAAEHFTAMLAEGALRHDSLLSAAHPVMRRLLLWHASEEIEHRAVTFDVLRRVSPGYGLRMAGLALSTAVLAGFWVAATVMLLRQDGVGAADVLRELRSLRRRDRIVERMFVRGIRQYVRRDFHPLQNDIDALAQRWLEESGLEAAWSSTHPM